MREDLTDLAQSVEDQHIPYKRIVTRLGWRASGAGDRKQLDAFLLARALEHDAPGSTVTAFCASFQTVEQLALVKSFVGTAANSNEPLLMASDKEGGASAEAPRNIFGVPLWSLPEGTIADGTIWALDRDKAYAVIRPDIGLMIDPSFYFGSDSLACRCIIRVGLGYPHHAAICKISLSGS